MRPKLGGEARGRKQGQEARGRDGRGEGCDRSVAFSALGVVPLVAVLTRGRGRVDPRGTKETDRSLFGRTLASLPPDPKASAT